jgi:hypothetical protein
MVVGVGAKHPSEVVPRIEKLAPHLGVQKVEVWPVSEQFLAEERQRAFAARTSIGSVSTASIRSQVIAWLLDPTC